MRVQSRLPACSACSVACSTEHRQAHRTATLSQLCWQLDKADSAPLRGGTEDPEGFQLLPQQHARRAVDLRQQGPPPAQLASSKHIHPECLVAKGSGSRPQVLGSKEAHTGAAQHTSPYFSLDSPRKDPHLPAGSLPGSCQEPPGVPLHHRRAPPLAQGKQRPHSDYGWLWGAWPGGLHPSLQ